MADRSVRVRLEAITSNFNRKISESSVLTREFSRQLESADGRMSNIVQTGLALAPALVPLGAAGIPAIAGLTAQLGFAALGTGALVLGLNGVGDALTALDNYKLDPTVEHFKKLQTTMEKLGPAGGEFVLFLDQIEPRLKQLRNLAEAGLLPGAEDGIRHLLRLMPELRQVVFTTSTTLGDLIKNAGDNLDDPRWHEFFGFLETRARPTLTEMGQTAGNFAAAFANLVTDFDPLERDFSKGLLHMSVVVKDWSDGLEQSTGFQNLVDYVRTNGPRALDTLQALAGTLLQIVEAAAPVGSVALPILTELLKVVGAIADTPLVGSGLVGIAAAIGIYGRSLALLKTVGLRGGEGVLASTFAGAKSSITGAASALTAVTSAQDRARLSATELAGAEERRSAAVQKGLTTAGKGVALAAGFAVAQSGVADKIGLANTASLALIGTIGGPWGAAAGAAIGFTMDLVHANDDLENAIKRANTAANQMDFITWRTSLHDILDANEKIQTAATPQQNGLFKNPGKFTKQGFENLVQLIPGVPDPGQAQKHADQAKQSFNVIRKAAVDLFATLNNQNPKGLKVTDDELTQFITRISPALQRAGIDINDLLNHRTGWLDAQLAVHAWVVEMDSAKGRSQAVGKALDDLQSQIIPTVDAAKALSDALDALFGPEVSQSQALDQWIGSLHTLRDELTKNKGAIAGNTDAALKSREAIRGSVEALLGRAKADAAAGVSGPKIAAELAQGRRAIIDTAVAAGASRAQVDKFLSSLGLTAANLATLLDRARDGVHKLSRAMRELKDKTVTIKVRNIYEATHADGGLDVGDVANRHLPELAGPGVTRIWREPETQGEAYIPLANDYRRPRAVDIWEKTGMALGVQFRRFALGGIDGGLGGGSEVRLAQGDVDRIVRGLATIRPIAERITVMPHNYSEWERQQQALTQAAGIGGSDR